MAQECTCKNRVKKSLKESKRHNRKYSLNAKESGNVRSEGGKTRDRKHEGGRRTRTTIRPKDTAALQGERRDPLGCRLEETFLRLTDVNGLKIKGMEKA